MKLVLIVCLVLVLNPTPAAADPVSAAIAAALVEAGVSAAVASVIGSIVTSTLSSLVLNTVSGALFGKPAGSGGALPSFSAEATARTHVVRTAVEPLRLIYGETRASGPLAFATSTGSSKEFLHMVVPVAGHEVESMGSFILNDTEITSDQIDGSGVVTVGKYANKLRVKKHLGAPDQAADSDLVAEVTEWTTDHRLREIAYMYLRLEHDDDVYPTGIPNPAAVVRGKKLYDPRTATTAWTANLALAVNDYKTSPLGLNIPDSEIDAADIIAAANVADEVVTVSDLSDTFTADATTDQLTLSDEKTDIKTGDRCTVSSTGTLPGGLAPATNYYYIQSANAVGQVATTLANAFAGTALTLTDAGTGTHTLTKNGQVRYDCHGIVSLDKPHISVVEDMLTSGAGFVSWSVGKHHLQLAAATTAETEVIEATWLRGPVKARPRVPRQNLFNLVRGTFVDPARFYQPTDFPPVGNINYEVQDGGWSDTFTVDTATDVLTVSGSGGRLNADTTVTLETTTTLPSPAAAQTRYHVIYVSDTTFKLATSRDNALAGTAIDFTDTGTGTHTVRLAEQMPRDIEFPFNQDATRAQRLAKIHLEKSRQGISVELLCNLKALKCRVLEVRKVTLPQFGWTEKEFRLIAFKFSGDLGIDLVLQEESSAAYDWAAGNATVHDPAPDTSLAPALTVNPATVLVLSSGTADLFVAGDGTVHSRIKAAWTAAVDSFVKQHEIQHKKSADSEWQTSLIGKDATEIYIPAVEDTVSYDVRVRAINGLGVKSEWVTVTGHTVVGKSAVPADHTTFSAQQNGNVVVFAFGLVADADLAGNDIRYMAAPFVWADATPLTEVTRGTQITSAGMPPGTWVCGIKARDTSGNYSATALTTTLTVSNVNDVVIAQEEATAWAGTLTNMVRHHTGVIVPDSQNLASDDAWETFDEFVVNPVTTCSYEGTEIDLGFDADGVRVWSDIQSGLGPGETAGTADPQFQIDVKDAADSYDGFEDWTVGTADFRTLKPKLTIASADGLPVVSGFQTTCDVEERSETHKDQTIAVSGTTVTFDNQFHIAPAIEVSAKSSASARHATYDNVTTTSVDIYVWDSGGTDVGGTATIKATGA